MQPTQPTHPWVARHLHTRSSSKNRHQCGAARRSSLYVWCPSCRATSCFHSHPTTHPNLTCFPQGESFSGGRVGQGGVGRGGVVPLPALFLLPLPPPHLVFYLCLNIMFLLKPLSFPCHCFLSAPPPPSLHLSPPPSPPSSPVSPSPCLSLLRLTGLCLYVVCSFRPTPCIAG